jgi:CRISPR-associated protein (TIGR03984 family)
MAFPEVSPALRVETVQQLRLFSVHGEVHLWKTQDGFNARVIQDQAVHQDPSRFYDETQWLYGAANQQKSGYTLMIEGEEGLEHAIPLTGSPGFRAGLKVRHYVAYDDQGQAYIPLSRLLELTIVEGRSI